MKKNVKVSCPLDCPDLCGFNATVEDGRITKLVPDSDHPVTKGFACKKGRNLFQRMYHPDRLMFPMVKRENGFEKVSVQQVMDLMAEKLFSIKEKYGTRAILNYSGTGGYGGLKDRIQTIFFNCFGGATEPEGSLCWGAGLAAQTYDFGRPRGHDPDDILNARFILVWGRNPKFTNIHLYALLKEAQKKGSRVIVIDPVQTATATSFDEYIRINPSTDGALALGMANVIIKNNLCDLSYIEKHVKGFDDFKSHAAQFTPGQVEAITGVPEKTIKDLALSYARAKTASIYIGFGIQRYLNGGNTVRCIDALGAITGRIGKRGCGVNYAAKSFSPYLFSLEKNSRKYIESERTFPVSSLGNFLQKENNPPVKAAFVHAANPLNQSPDLRKTIDQFSKVEFKVVFDHFMTDTARHADIVIPAAFVYEQEDLFVTGMYSPILNHSKKAVDPPQGVIPEFDFYLQLAEKMGIENLGFQNSKEYLEKSAGPLLEKEGGDFASLAEIYPRISGNEIPWSSKVFDTPSGKIELYSEQAQKDGLTPLPSYQETLAASKDFPLRLLTCHANDSIHSQGFAFIDDMPEVYVNQETADSLKLENHSLVVVNGKHADIKATLIVDDAINKNTAFIYQGYWHKSGAVNFLTDSGVSDMGGQAAYYDSFVTITPCD